MGKKSSSLLNAKKIRAKLASDRHRKQRRRHVSLAVREADAFWQEGQADEGRYVDTAEERAGDMRNRRIIT